MVNSVCILVFAMASLSFCFGDDDRVGSFSLVDEVSGNDRDINNRMTLTTMTTTTPRSSTTMNVTSTGNMSSSASTTETSEASTSDSSYSTDDTTTEEATSSYPSTTKPPVKNTFKWTFSVNINFNSTSSSAYSADRDGNLVKSMRIAAHSGVKLGFLAASNFQMYKDPCII